MEKNFNMRMNLHKNSSLSVFRNYYIFFWWEISFWTKLKLYFNFFTNFVNLNFNLNLQKNLRLSQNHSQSSQWPIGFRHQQKAFFFWLAHLLFIVTVHNLRISFKFKYFIYAFLLFHCGRFRMCLRVHPHSVLVTFDMGFWCLMFCSPRQLAFIMKMGKQDFFPSPSGVWNHTGLKSQQSKRQIIKKSPLSGAKSASLSTHHEWGTWASGVGPKLA